MEKNSPEADITEKTRKAGEIYEAATEKANRCAAKIIKDAGEKAKEVTEKAREKGYREGYKKGREDAGIKARKSLEKIEKLFCELDENKSEVIRENEKNIIKLALKIAGKVIDKELSEDDKVFLNMFKRAAEDICGEKWVKLTVSDYESGFATMSSDYLLGMVRDAEQIEIKVDENAPRGTCIIETESTIVDSSASSQLEIMEKTLLGM